MTDKQKLEAVALLLGIDNHILIPERPKKRTAKQIYQEDYNKLLNQVNESQALRLIKSCKKCVNIFVVVK